MTYLFYTGYQIFTRIHVENYLFPILPPVHLCITMTISVSVVKDGLQSYLDKTYSRCSIKIYILILIVFRKCHLPKHLTFGHFMLPSLMKNEKSV
jgi:hypothetical protein